jgi:hypothetical protein
MNLSTNLRAIYAGTALSARFSFRVTVLVAAENKL